MVVLLSQIEAKIRYTGKIQVDDQVYIEDPFQIVAGLASHLHAFGFPPDRPFEPVFVFTMQTWSSAAELTSFGRWGSEVMKAIHQMPDRAERVLSFYREVAHEAPTLGVDGDILQAQYQNFKRTAKAAFTFELPVSLLEYIPGNLSGDVEKAFEWLTKWDTAFDGVKLLSALLLANPKCNVLSQFDKLLYSQKQFLIEGLKLSNKDEGAENEKLAAVIQSFEQRALEPRVDVDAEVEKVRSKAEDMSKSSITAGSPRTPERRVDRARRESPATTPGEILHFSKH
jgi:hypothetical protein